MKKAVIFVCGVILFISLILMYKAYLNISHSTSGIQDKTSNINVMLTRPDNWERITDKAVIEESDMIIVDGSTATIPITAELLRQFYNYPDNAVQQSKYVQHSTTHNAYVNLIDSKTTSLIFVTAPSEEEKQLAADKQLQLDITPIAKDGFVFITNKDNPVNSLTIDQIQKIYTGEITNWKEVGGENLAIQAFQREANSGSQTAMEQLVMKGKSLKSPINTKVIKFQTMGTLIDAVAEYENGKASIGYTYYYYINNLYKNDNIKVIKINGISPENKNLINETYPFTTSYYAVMRADEAVNSPARKLRDWLITDKGQQLIEAAGYCRSVKFD